MENRTLTLADFDEPDDYMHYLKEEKYRIYQNVNKEHKLVTLNRIVDEIQNRGEQNGVGSD